MAATASDQFRKPSTGMWDFLISNILVDEIKVDMKNSFYCGDAAGRPKTANRPKDFSDADIKFSRNIELQFYTPEHLFLGEKDKLPKVQSAINFAAAKENVRSKSQDETSNN